LRLDNFHFVASLDSNSDNKNSTLENIRALTVNDLYFVAEQFIFKNGVFGRKILYLESFT